MHYKLARELRILIIEHQIFSKGYLRYSMEELGFRNIDYTKTANEAKEALNTVRYDLILCAYDLKEEQEGYFLYTELLEHKALPPSTAFVFISADTSPDIVNSIVELQPDDFIARPFSVKDLDKRLSRLIKRKQALKPVYTCVEKNALDDALFQTEQFLLEPKNAEFFPVALKLKGELLLACGQFEAAREFYLAILNVQKFTWAQIGLVKCHIHLNQDEEAEKLILALAFQNDSKLVAYDLLSALKIKQQEFDDALESVMEAAQLSPRNIQRHRHAMDLSRLTHDYESRFEAAKKIIRFAKNSIHDTPEVYLSVARAGIDYAMTADEDQTQSLIRQSKEYLKRLRSRFSDDELTEQLKVIDARLLYLQDETEKALALLSQLSDDGWGDECAEALLDKAKAFHTLGLQEHALTILDTIDRRCNEAPPEDNLFLSYIRMERQEKAAIALPPRALNNLAVNQYQQGDIHAALESFRQAFTIMPKNPAIALNLLQAIATNNTQSDSDDKRVHACMKILESNPLSAEQEQRYLKIRTLLQDWG
ncbi:response regulator [Alteromonas aestuariivivens]|uniref:Response regulator n=1 Tax=Alteromonas aestuariivivens TaxID=1938339 RepID=A0A3D8M409_9ALTE|nr:response regulator [Alteromonas aestuariivivens]